MENNKNLNEFPKEVIDRMLEEQVRQGNKKDIGVFEDFITASKSDGGFDWADTIEGHYFWNDVINVDFNLFFKMYPKSKYPKVMYVCNDKERRTFKRVVIARIDRGYVAIKDATTLEEAAKSIELTVWKYVEDVKSQKELKNIELEIINLMMNFKLSRSILVHIINNIPNKE